MNIVDLQRSMMDDWIIFTRFKIKCICTWFFVCLFLILDKRLCACMSLCTNARNVSLDRLKRSQNPLSNKTTTTGRNRHYDNFEWYFIFNSWAWIQYSMDSFFAIVCPGFHHVFCFTLFFFYFNLFGLSFLRISFGLIGDWDDPVMLINWITNDFNRSDLTSLGFGFLFSWSVA